MPDIGQSYWFALLDIRMTTEVPAQSKFADRAVQLQSRDGGKESLTINDKGD
jgi:hypothetical protein